MKRVFTIINRFPKILLFMVAALGILIGTFGVMFGAFVVASGSESFVMGILLMGCGFFILLRGILTILKGHLIISIGGINRVIVSANISKGNEVGKKLKKVGLNKSAA